MPRATGLTSTRKLADILAVTQALTLEVNLDALLVKIMDAATRLLDAERSTLYLVDDRTGELVSKIAQQAETREIRLPMGTGIAGAVAATGQVANVPHAYADPRFNPAVDTGTGYRTRNLLTAPVLSSHRERIGVIQAINHRRGAFGEGDVGVLLALASSAGVAIEHARLYAQIEAMLQSFVRTLAASIDARDSQTAGHSQRVGGYAARVMRELDGDPRRHTLIYLAGLLHDYGKIGVPEAILTKPGPLSADEARLMRGHARMSREILANVAFTAELNRIPEIVYQHHERLDGSGYPRGLRGSEISLEGRVLAVCDVFDALTHQRYYRAPISHAEALAYIAHQTGTHFDPDVVGALSAILGREGRLGEWHLGPPEVPEEAPGLDGGPGGRQQPQPTG